MVAFACSMVNLSSQGYQLVNFGAGKGSYVIKIFGELKCLFIYLGKILDDEWDYRNLMMK